MPVRRCSIPECMHLYLSTSALLVTHQIQVVLQCLYSQCPTTQFGSALHYALLECPSFGNNESEYLPPLIGHQGLRKRANKPLASVSAQVLGHYVSASAGRLLARRSVIASAFVRARPTRSQDRYPAQATGTPKIPVFKLEGTAEPSSGVNISHLYEIVPTKTS